MSTFPSDLLDFEAYFPKDSGKWPSLKMIFDNLRCYPILGIYIFGLKYLGSAGDIWSSITFWFLLLLFMFLGFACLFQTACLLSVLIIGIFSTFNRPNEKASQVLQIHKRLVNKLSVGLFTLLFTLSSFVVLKFFEAYARYSQNI